MNHTESNPRSIHFFHYHGISAEVQQFPAQDDPDTQQRLLAQLYSVMDVNPSGSEILRNHAAIFCAAWEDSPRQLDAFSFLSLQYIYIYTYVYIYI